MAQERIIKIPKQLTEKGQKYEDFVIEAIKNGAFPTQKNGFTILTIPNSSDFQSNKTADTKLLMEILADEGDFEKIMLYFKLPINFKDEKVPKGFPQEGKTWKKFQHMSNQRDWYIYKNYMLFAFSNAGYPFKAQQVKNLVNQIPEIEVLNTNEFIELRKRGQLTQFKEEHGIEDDEEIIPKATRDSVAPIIKLFNERLLELSPKKFLALKIRWGFLVFLGLLSSFIFSLITAQIISIKPGTLLILELLKQPQFLLPNALLIWGTIFCAQEYRATKHYQRSYEFKISCLKSLHHWLKINFMDEKIIEKITELTWEKIITPPGSAYKKNEPPTLNNFTHSK